MKRLLLTVFVLTAGLFVSRHAFHTTADAAPPADAGKKTHDEAAVARARKTVGMLDDIYKKTIVLITDKYVNDADDFAAGRAAVLLFKQITDSGMHTVRLIDATGEPYAPKNVAKDAFEKEGIKRLKEGAKSFEQIADEKGKPVLRVVTPIPVVMKKCVMCHAHYADAKPGEPIGAISYSIPIE